MASVLRAAGWRTTKRSSTSWSRLDPRTWSRACRPSPTTCSRAQVAPRPRRARRLLVSNCSVLDPARRGTARARGGVRSGGAVVRGPRDEARCGDLPDARAAGGCAAERAVFVDDQPRYCDGATAVDLDSRLILRPNEDVPAATGPVRGGRRPPLAPVTSRRGQGRRGPAGQAPEEDLREGAPPAPGGLVKMEEWVRADRRADRRDLRGTRRRGQGRRDQADHAVPEPARHARIVALPTPTEREHDAVVLPAVRRRTSPRPARSSCSTGPGTTAPASSTSRGSAPAEEYPGSSTRCPIFERLLVEDGIILLKYWFSVSDEEQERRFRRAARRPDAPVEAVGPICTRAAVGRLLAREGRDVRPHRHPRGAVVRGGGRRQAASAAELHRAPAVDDPVPGRAPARRSSSRRGSATTATCDRRATSTRTCPTTPARCSPSTRRRSTASP